MNPSNFVCFTKIFTSGRPCFQLLNNFLTNIGASKCFSFHSSCVRPSYTSHSFVTNRTCPSTIARNIIGTCKPDHRKFSLTNYKYHENDSEDDNNSTSETDSEDDDMDDDEKAHQELSQNVYKLIPGMGHKVLLLLPKVKWGPKKNYNTTPELQLAEAETLVHTLENWTVVQKAIVNCVSPGKKYLFGSGNLEKVTEMAANPEVTAVLVSQNSLTGLQQASLEQCFRKPVYDRHTIVLRIFLEHAKSKEAKLQVALAELPYLRSRLRLLHEQGYERESGAMSHIGGAGETYMELRRRMLYERELKLKKKIEKLKASRRMLRESQRRKTFPSVAIIGYTNSGKTSLIKALTNDEKLVPKPYLFATLDVTAHTGFLPCQQAVIFVDTVGFITDIPTNLIQSFIATLDDISSADLIIHIWDASHPDIVNQKETVKKTLESLSLPPRLTGSMLHIGNKMDLLQGPIQLEEGEFLISATEGIGLDRLWQEIQERLMQNTGMLFQSVRVPNGGEEMSWLKKRVAIQDVTVDPEDWNFLIMNIVCDHAVKKMFHHHFSIKMENQKLG